MGGHNITRGSTSSMLLPSPMNVLTGEMMSSFSPMMMRRVWREGGSWGLDHKCACVVCTKFFLLVAGGRKRSRAVAIPSKIIIDVI